jgi:alkyl sulfatase BDS1-like metallo-beta-lactamase superfamily hydrolase
LEWRPNIELENYKPALHGWKMNNGNILLSYATEQKTTSNKNIYRSLQLEEGNHRLSFHATTPGEQVIGVKLQKLSDDKSVVLDNTVTVGEGTDVALDFTTEGGWAEYHFEITRQDTEAEIAISKIEIHKVADQSGIINATTVLPRDGAVYDLSGRRVSPDSKGIIIIDGKKKVNP